MKRVVMLLGVLAVVATGGMFYARHSFSRAITGDVADLRGKTEVSVVLTDTGFEPATFRIDKGTTVVFSTTRQNQFWPASNPHPTHELYGGFDPREPINPGHTWSFTFNNAGIWGFHDHLRSYFTGTVYVE